MNELNFYYNKNLKDFTRRLRRESTQAEVKLWQEVLRGKKMHGYGFLRQRPVLNYIADFMCKQLWLIIEIDGYTHHWESKWKLDMKRQKKLEDIGFTVLRFTDEEVIQDIRNVERVIEQWVLDHPPAPLQRENQTTHTA
ncbi:MAG: endonuclease domain-containing protein [Balneolaceae bacterium]